MMNRLLTRLTALTLTCTPAALALAQRDAEAEPFVAAYIPVLIIMGLGILLIIPSFKNCKRSQAET